MSKYEEKKTNGNYQVVFYKWVRDGPCALGLFTSSQETMSIISKAHQCQIQIFTYWIVLNIVDFKLFRYFLLYTSCKNAPKTCWPKGKVNHRQHKSRSFCWPFVVLWPRDSSSWGWGTSRTQRTSLSFPDTSPESLCSISFPMVAPHSSLWKDSSWEVLLLMGKLPLCHPIYLAVMLPPCGHNFMSPVLKSLDLTNAQHMHKHRPVWKNPVGWCELIWEGSVYIIPRESQPWHRPHPSSARIGTSHLETYLGRRGKDFWLSHHLSLKFSCGSGSQLKSTRALG